MLNTLHDGPASRHGVSAYRRLSCFTFRSVEIVSKLLGDPFQLVGNLRSLKNMAGRAGPGVSPKSPRTSLRRSRVWWRIDFESFCDYASFLSALGFRKASA
jgi:hypothetical protein